MRHIKGYTRFTRLYKDTKIFEEYGKVGVTPDNIQDLEDILVEVKDMGYTIEIKDRDRDGYQIAIYNRFGHQVSWSDLREYIIRIEEYITDVIGTPFDNKTSIFVNGVCNTIESFDNKYNKNSYSSSSTTKRIQTTFTWKIYDIDIYFNYKRYRNQRYIYD